MARYSAWDRRARERQLAARDLEVLHEVTADQVVPVSTTYEYNGALPERHASRVIELPPHS